MILELGKTYTDRRGIAWRVIHTEGQRIAPVTAERWEGKNYRTRTFQRDGTYWHPGSGYEGKPDAWDLTP